MKEIMALLEAAVEREEAASIEARVGADGQVEETGLFANFMNAISKSPDKLFPMCRWVGGWVHGSVEWVERGVWDPIYIRLISCQPHLLPPFVRSPVGVVSRMHLICPITVISARMLIRGPPDFEHLADEHHLPNNHGACTCLPCRTMPCLIGSLRFLGAAGPERGVRSTTDRPTPPPSFNHDDARAHDTTNTQTPIPPPTPTNQAAGCPSPWRS